VFGDRLPEITEADERRVDEMIAKPAIGHIPCTASWLARHA
jgi:hypothetical protein